MTWSIAMKGSQAPVAPAGAVNDSESPEVVALLRHRNVVLEGVAGTGKSYAIGQVRGFFARDPQTVVVFHPATSYEDFVEGLRPTTSGGFEVRNGAFLEFCRRATKRWVESWLEVVGSRMSAPQGFPERAKHARAIASAVDCVLKAPEADKKDAGSALVEAAKTLVEAAKAPAEVVNEADEHAAKAPAEAVNEADEHAAKAPAEAVNEADENAAKAPAEAVNEADEHAAKAAKKDPDSALVKAAKALVEAPEADKKDAGSALVEAANEAKDSQAKAARCLFVIDEINRANTAKVMGDLLYSIDPSKRASAGLAAKVLFSKDTEPPTPDSDGSGREEPVPVQLLLERPVDKALTTAQGGNGNGGTHNGAQANAATYRQWFVVPDNVYILGTMNTTDRSVGTIDLALRRRFSFLRIEPLTKDALKGAIDTRQSPAHDVDRWHKINEWLGQEVSPDSALGHSYFFDVRRIVEEFNLKAGEASQILWRDYLLPQLAEVLVTFSAVQNLGDPWGEKADDGTLSKEVFGQTQISETSESDQVEWWLKVFGQGIDAYPLPRPYKPDQSTNGDGPESGTNGSAE